MKKLVLAGLAVTAAVTGIVVAVKRKRKYAGTGRKGE